MLSFINYTIFAKDYKQLFITTFSLFMISATWANPTELTAQQLNAKPVAKIEYSSDGVSVTKTTTPSLIVDAPKTEVKAVKVETEKIASTETTAPVGKLPKDIYNTSCFVCHNAGIANAPKLSDKAMWAPKVALGIDELLANTIKGKGAMPPRAGTTYSDAELKATIEWMIKQ